MNGFTKKIIYFLIIIPVMFSWGQENIRITSDINSAPDEKQPNAFLLNAITPFFQNVVSAYNNKVTGYQKVDKIILSEIFKSRTKQRESHFKYITTGPGVISFLHLYDKYNSQFAVQFLHIIMPVFATPQASKKLFGTVNQSLDKVLKTNFTKSNDGFISEYLLKRLQISTKEEISKVVSSINVIAKDASSYYDLDDDFISAVQDALKNNIYNKYHVSTDEAIKAAQVNFNILLFTEIIRLIQPQIKQMGQSLFTHATIGSELAHWFESAPAFNKHSIIGVSDKDITNLGIVLDSGRGFQFAVDISTKKTMDRSGSPVWSPDVSNNTLKTFVEALTANKNLKINDYTISLIPDTISLSSHDNDIHLEFVISKQDILNSTENSDDTDVDFNEPTQNPTVNSNIVNDPTMEKNFELPNDDYLQNGKIRPLNIKNYNKILGAADNGTNKRFETGTPLDQEETTPLAPPTSEKPDTSNQDDDQDENFSNMGNENDDLNDMIQEKLTQKIHDRLKKRMIPKTDQENSENN